LIHESFAGSRNSFAEFLFPGVEPDASLSRSSGTGTVHDTFTFS